MYTGLTVTPQSLSSTNQYMYLLKRKDNNSTFCVDAENIGSVARFAIHSCNPNAYLQSWFANTEVYLVLISRQDIRMNNEITIDYSWTCAENPQRCYCCSPECKGTIHKLPSTQSANDSEMSTNVNATTSLGSNVDDLEVVDTVNTSKKQLKMNAKPF